MRVRKIPTSLINFINECNNYYDKYISTKEYKQTEIDYLSQKIESIKNDLREYSKYLFFNKIKII